MSSFHLLSRLVKACRQCAIAENHIIVCNSYSLVTRWNTGLIQRKEPFHKTNNSKNRLYLLFQLRQPEFRPIYQFSFTWLHLHSIFFVTKAKLLTQSITRVFRCLHQCSDYIFISSDTLCLLPSYCRSAAAAAPYLQNAAADYCHTAVFFAPLLLAATIVLCCLLLLLYTSFRCMGFSFSWWIDAHLLGPQ